MFDTYLVSLECPLDGSPVNEWQGKDGPCLLYTWQVGQAAPLEATTPYDPADDEPLTLGEVKLPSFRRPWLEAAKAERLPPVFELHANHGDHQLEALGETDPIDDSWRSVRLIEVTSSVLMPGEFWPPIMPGGKPSPKYEGIRLYREGAGINQVAMTRRATEHERIRTGLPAHGGAAICRDCAWRDSDRKVPAVGYAFAYLCNEHLPSASYDPDQIIR